MRTILLPLSLTLALMFSACRDRHLPENRSAAPANAIKTAPAGAVERLKPGDLDILLVGHDIADAVCSVSSVLDGNEQRYGAAHLVDRDPHTVWAVRNGVGERITLRLHAPEEVCGLYIVGGYAKSRALWSDNNRVQSIRLTVYAHGSHSDYDITIPDDPDFSHFDAQLWGQYIPLPHRPQVDSMRARITAVYQGKKYNDLCITAFELVTRITSEEPE